MESRAGGTPREITHYDGVHGSASRGRPEGSPDGGKLVYLQSSGAKLGAYNMNRLAVVAVSGGEPRVLAGGLDRGVSAPRFTPDGASLLFLVRRGGGGAGEAPRHVSRRMALRFCSWWATTPPNIRRGFRPMAATCSG